MSVVLLHFVAVPESPEISINAGLMLGSFYLFFTKRLVISDRPVISYLLIKSKQNKREGGAELDSEFLWKVIRNTENVQSAYATL